MKDYAAAKKEKYGEIKNQLPKMLRKLNQNLIQFFTGSRNGFILFAMCFLLGMIISAGEFLCTGQLYIATIALVAVSGSTLSLSAFLYLVVYAGAFILPLIAVIFVISKTREILDVSEFIRHRLHLIKLVNAILFLLAGVLIMITM
jgi:hypothetical protein